MFFRTSGSFSFSGISSSSSSAAVLFGSLKKLGPVSQSDPVRLCAFRQRVLRSAGFSLVSIYFHCLGLEIFRIVCTRLAT